LFIFTPAKSDALLAKLTWVRWVFTLVCLLFVIPIVITALSLPAGFAPDEASWLDSATTPYVSGMLANRTTLRDTYKVYPSLGLGVAAYGWTLENLWYDPRMGRMWTIAAYFITILTAGAIARRLYGNQAAVVTMAHLFLSEYIFPNYEYKPSHQLSAVAMLVTFFAIEARYLRKAGHPGYAWDFACGLTATLAVQVHTIGVVFATASSLFYLAEFLLKNYRNRQWNSLWPMLAFGVGALIGVIIHYAFNVQPIGGYAAYLEGLAVQNAYAPIRQSPLTLHWTGTVEIALAWAGIAYLLWRRASQDALFLGIFLCVGLSILLLDKQGYFQLHRAFYAIPVGTLIISGVSPNIQYKPMLLAVCALSIMLIMRATTFVSWPLVAQTIRTGTLESPYQAFVTAADILKENGDIREDDVIVTTHQLLWGMKNASNIYSVESERWSRLLADPDRQGIEVWEYINPTAIIFMNDAAFTWLLTDSPELLHYTREYAYEECRAFQVEQLEVKVYRRDCG
jgi:hypothetical protein